MGRDALDREPGRGTVSAATLRAFADAFTRLGYDAEALLRGANLSSADLSDPDAEIPGDACRRFFEGAHATQRLPNIGARLGAATPIGAFPLLDYLVLTCETVGGALEQLVRYFRVVAAPCALSVVHDDDAARLISSPGSDSFNAQYQASIVLHHLRVETNGAVRVRHVSLVTEPEDRRDLEQLLGCPVRSPAPWSGIEFPRDALEIPLRRRDPALRAMLEDHARALTVGAPPDQPSIVDAVRAALTSRFGHGVPDVETMARRLGLATRTLQRRLAAAGATYQQVVDLTRREAAERLLSDASLGVGQVAFLLGFSEPSAFHRAFKRWHGVTPQEYRRRHRRVARSNEPAHSAQGSQIRAIQ